MYYETALNFVSDTILSYAELCSFNPNVSFLTLGIGLILFSWLLAFVSTK